MRFHLTSLPHTETTAEHVGCAYTQKVVKFCRMMMGRGHEVILYAGERNEAPCSEHVVCLSRSEREVLFGVHDPNDLPGWPDLPLWERFNRRVIEEVSARHEQGDFVLLPGGYSQHQVVDELASMMVVEPFVGYEGIYANHAAFESYSHMHSVYALKGIRDGRWFDAVIPNFFDPDEFKRPAEEWNPSDDGYLLFLGRLVSRKGPQIAAEIAEAAGQRLLIAGAGATMVSEGLIVSPEVRIEGDVTYIGPVGVGERAELLSGATALLAPTLYMEPFGGVAVEAMMSGTPAITSDWGAFTETVPERYRFRTLQEAVECVDRADDEYRVGLRRSTVSQFSLEAVAPMFEEWFDRLSTLWAGGWYQRKADSMAGSRATLSP